MSSSNSSRRKSQRGNAILEFAVGWFLMWLLFSGVYEFGYVFYVYNRLLTNVANAAELGAKIDYDAGSPSTFTTTLQNMVVYGDEKAGTSPIVSGLTTSDVNVNVTTDTNGIPHDVTVTVTGYKVDAIFQSFTLPKPRATVLYYGHVTCATCT